MADATCRHAVQHDACQLTYMYAPGYHLWQWAMLDGQTCRAKACPARLHFIGVAAARQYPLQQQRAEAASGTAARNPTSSSPSPPQPSTVAPNAHRCPTTLNQPSVRDDTLFSHATARVTEQRTCVWRPARRSSRGTCGEGDSPPLGKRTQTFRPRSSRNMSGYVAVSTPATSLPPAPALLARSTSGCSGCGSSSSPALRRGCHPTSARHSADEGACGQCSGGDESLECLYQRGAGRQQQVQTPVAGQQYTWWRCRPFSH